MGIVDLGVEGAVRRVVESWEQAAELESMCVDSIEECAGLKQQTMGLVTVYLQSVVDACEFPLAVEVSMEEPLIDPDTGEDLGIPLTGIVDLVVDERTGPLICDFKTAAKASAPFDEIQLSSYA